MPEVQFEEEQYQTAGAEQKPFFVRLVLATHVVSTEQQAKYVLIAFAVIGIILSVVLFAGVGGGHTPQKPPLDLLQEMPTNQ